MKTHLPPLSSIRAFEAVSRHLSFTKAGDELGMTQAAMSYQIKLLEERLGFKLFNRMARKIELTPKGAELSHGVVGAFDQLRSSFEDIQESNAAELVINSNTTFAVTWLATRLVAFQIQNPDIAVRIVPYGPWEKPSFDDADVTISSCFEPPKGSVFSPLVPAEFTPLVSPKLLETSDPLETPADLLKLPIIDPDDPWWKIWFAEAGVRDPDLSKWPTARMGSQALEANRAIAGQGVAILTPYFCREALANGQLVQPFDLISREEGEAWNLSFSPHLRNSRKVRLFKQWIYAELAKDGMTGADAVSAA